MKKEIRKKKHRMLAAFLCSCIMFTLPGISDIPSVVAAEQEESSVETYAEENNHGHDGKNFEAWDNTDSLPTTAGNYCLTENVTLSAAWNVPSGTTNLCLNGHTLTGMGNASVVIIPNNATLNLYDCKNNEGKITGGGMTATSALYGGGVNVSGTFYMYGGTITGNRSYVTNDAYYGGGGVYVNGGSFTMYGGSITDNTTSRASGMNSNRGYGGGVDVYKGSFTLSGGTISNNYADTGGNVSVSSDASFTMDDGTISKGNSFNTSSGVYNKGVFTMNKGEISDNKKYGVECASSKFSMNGGTISGSTLNGVYCTNGDFSMNGGTISGNETGVSWSGSTTFSVSGDAKVNGNTKNVSLSTGKKIIIMESGLTEGASIGITSSKSLTADEPIDVTGENNADYSKYFFSDDGTYEIQNSGDGSAQVVQLVKHVHSYTYSGDGAVITESCTCGHSETAALSMSDGVNLTYTGYAIEACRITYSDSWAGGTLNLSYSNNINAGRATATISKSGETASLNFDIAEKSLTDSMITLASGPNYYTGNAVTPAVTVKDGSKTLVSGTDYTVSYANNTNAGTATATVTVTGKGNYTGTINRNFTITGKSLTDSMITLASGPHYYTGSAVTPAVTVKDGSKTLVSGTDYTISYTDNTNAGTATVTVTGMGNYTGIINKDFTITGKSLTDSMVTIVSGPHNYTGSAVTPAVTVTDGSETLVSGTDYTVSYTNNTNAGTAIVTVTGKGNYTGTINKNFTITSKSLTDSMITLASGPNYYTGSAVTPAVTVKDGSKTLVSGTDYTVSYTNNTNAGTATATVTVTGKGNYTGTINKNFTITGKSLTDSMVTIASGPHYYTGSAVTPAVTVKDGSKTLVSGTDYTVSYKNNTNVGTATVTVVGKGNYTGTIEKTFDIILTDVDKVAAAKEVVEDILEGITVTNSTTKQEIQNKIDTALTQAGITEVTVTVGELEKTEATTEAAGSIGGNISIVSQNDSSVTDSVPVNKTIEKLPGTDAEKVEVAKKVVEEALAGITVTNETTKDDIQKVIDTALTNAGMTDVTVTVRDLDKTEATTDEAGIIDGSITIVSDNDSSVTDSVTVNKTIEKLPETDAEKVAAAKKIVEEALAGITATNETTKDSIQKVIDTALTNAGVAGVTVTVAEFDRTEATTSEAGKISGTVSIECGSETDSAIVGKTITKLPTTDADKVEAAKKVVKEALAGITATNTTAQQDIQKEIDTALTNAGITDVIVTVGEIEKTEATTSEAGSIRGNVVIECGSETDSVAVSKTISKFPGTDTEKVEAAKEVVKDVLAGITATNSTTEQDIQEKIHAALEDAGITGVTVTVAEFDKTEATASEVGSISGSIVIESDNDSDVTGSITMNKTIAKLPDTAAEKVEAAKSVVKEILAGITADNETTKEDIQREIDEALTNAGITDVTVTVGDLDRTEATTSEAGSVSGSITIESDKDSDVTDSVPIIKTIEKLPKTDAEKVEDAKKVVEDVLEEVLAKITTASEVTSEDIQREIDEALTNAGITDVTVTVGELDKTEATTSEEGSISGSITIESDNDSDVTDSVAISKTIEKLPKTEAEKVADAKKVVEETLEGITASNSTTTQEIQDKIDEALTQAGITEVTVTVGDLTKVDATTEAAGSIGGTISIVSKNDSGETDSVPIIKTIEKLPKTEDEKVADAKNVVEETLAGITATNSMTKQEIQEKIDEALTQAGITEVTVTVGELAKTEATTEEAGSISGTISIVSKNDLGETDSVPIIKTIEKLPKTEAEKVADAKKVVEEILAGITATNSTTKQEIQEKIDEALTQAGITEVTVTVGDLEKTEATTDAAGSIGGNISIISKNDSSETDSVPIIKTIEKLPKTEAEKVADAKKVVEEILAGITATNGTTKQEIQDKIDEALTQAGITEVTVTVGELAKTEATTEEAGSIGGNISIVSKNDSGETDSVPIIKTIEKLPKTEAEKVADAKKVVEETLEGITASNSTTTQEIQDKVDEALTQAGITEVTVTVGELAKTEATTEEAGSIGGTISIVSKNDSDVTDSVLIIKTIEKLPKTEAEKVADAKKVVEDVLEEVLAGITTASEVTSEDIQREIDEALTNAGITDVTVTVGDLTKTEATTEEEGSISGSITLISDNDSDVTDSVPIHKTIAQLHTHSYTWIITKEATADEEGEMTGTCICGEVTTEMIPRTGESGSGTVIVKEDEENECNGSLEDKEDVKGKVSLTDTEKEQLNTGEDLVIILRLKDVSVAVDTQEKTEIQDKLETNTLGTFLDIELLKQIGGTETKITETIDEIEITFEIPEHLRNTDDTVARTYQIMRHHDGVVDILDVENYDETAHLLTFKTDKFSAYALVYRDAAKNPTATPGPTETPGTPSPTPVTTETPGTPTATPVTTETPDTSTPTPVPTETPGIPTATPVTTETPGTPTATPITTETPGTPLPTPGTTATPEIVLTKDALSINALLNVSQTGKKINIAWGKVAGADGYDVYVQYCGKEFTKKSITAIKSGKTTKVTVKKVNGKALNQKKIYKIYVLAYKLVNGKKITLAKTITAHIAGKKNAKYTNVKVVKVRKSSYSLKQGKTAVIKASTVLESKGKKQLSNAHAKEFRYATDNKEVATVSKKGKIKAVGKGSCTIYVYARNGCAKKIKVKVK